MTRAALLLAAALASPARAATLIADATTIEAGQSITFNVTDYPLLPLSTTCPNICEIQGFAGGGANFSSGDGQSNIIFGAFSADFTLLGPVTFTYATPGDYVASASGQLYGHTLRCGPGGCGSAFPNGLPYFSFDVFKNITVLPAAVPEPGTWALMLLGMLALVLVRNTKGRIHAWRHQ